MRLTLLAVILLVVLTLPSAATTFDFQHVRLNLQALTGRIDGTLLGDLSKVKVNSITGLVFDGAVVLSQP